jgi:hypothetical protein
LHDVTDLVLGTALTAVAELSGIERTFLLLLIEPSFQTNLSPAQWEMLPLLPEHGLLAASAGIAVTKAAARIRARNAFKLSTMT